jgi:hypothetical protein
MRIKASCTSGFAFAVKEEFAGKLVKCPKCSAAVTIPGKPTQQPVAASKPSSTKNKTMQESTRVVQPGVVANASGSKKSLTAPPKYERKPKSTGSNQVVWNRTEKFNPILDLLDEAGVKRAATGPVCPHCEAEMSPTAVICVHCGFNRETGERLETFSDIRDENANTSMHIETDTEQLLAKAERDIRNAPVSTTNQDFGDGSDSIVVALGALLGFGLIIVAGVLTVLIMDRLAEQANPAMISFVTSTALVVACYLYITYTAFRVNSIHGLVCLLTIEYCVIFAFMQGRSLILFGIIMKVAMIISAVSGYIQFGT